MREPPANELDNPYSSFFVELNEWIIKDYKENEDLKIDRIVYVDGDNSAGRDDIFALRGLQVLKSHTAYPCCGPPFTEYKVRDLLKKKEKNAL